MCYSHMNKRIVFFLSRLYVEITLILLITVVHKKCYSELSWFSLKIVFNRREKECLPPKNEMEMST